MIQRILEILEARWLIHRDTAISYLPLFISFLNGQKVSWYSDDHEDPRLKPRAVALGAEPGTIYNTWELDDSNILANSIAIIPIDGVIVSWKSMELIDSIRLAEANENIIAILFQVNSPGGMVFMTDIVANTIKSVTKPTVAMIMNMAASAAMWMISAMDYRIATSAMDTIGSIGVKTSITDMQVLLKDKLGINITDLYATKSTHKDEFYREFLKGNEKPITDDLDFVNDIFHAAIRDNLKIAADSDVFTGATYNAQEAIGMGLINEINSIEYAIDYAYKQGLANIIKQFKL